MRVFQVFLICLCLLSVSSLLAQQHESFFLKGDEMMRRSDYDSASYYYRKGLKSCVDCSDGKRGMRMLDLSYSLKIERKLDESLSYLISAEELFERSDNNNGLGLTYVRMMEHYRSVARYSKALEYIPIIEQIHAKKPLPAEILGKFYGRCAAVYIEGQGDIESSLKYSFKVLKIADSIGDRDLIATASNEIGYAYENLTDRRSEDFYNRAVSIWKKDSNYRSMISAMSNLARAKLKLGKVKESLAYFERSIELCDSLGFIILKADMYLSMHQIYRSQKNYDLSFDALNKYHELHLQQSKTIWEESLLELEQKYSLEKERVITNQERNRAELAEKDASQKRRELQLAVIMLSLSTVLILAIVVLLYRNRRSNQQLSKTNEKLIQAVHDKDLIFQELHHRVKNNLSLLESLLFLKSRDAESEEAREVLQESLGRVHSMAVVHQNLYDTGNDSASINLFEFSRQLFEDIRQSTLSKNPGLDLTVSGSDVSLDMSRAIQFGLILNELTTNTLKHADHESLEASLEIYDEKGELRIVYTDNGQKDFDLNSSSGGFGLRLIELMAKQLKASFFFTREHGRSVFQFTMRS